MHLYHFRTDYHLYMKVSKHLLAQHADPQLRHWSILRFEILQLYYGRLKVLNLSKRRINSTSLQ
jgi:hypothetical protein